MVGPNGSGKATLLRILRGDLEPDAGSRIGAGLVAGVLPRTFQDLGLPLGEAVGGAEAGRWIRKAGFRPPDLVRPLSTFSGGERTRLLLAWPATLTADVWLLDEPTNHLDLPGRRAAEGWLSGLRGPRAAHREQPVDRGGPNPEWVAVWQELSTRLKSRAAPRASMWLPVPMIDRTPWEPVCEDVQ